MNTSQDIVKVKLNIPKEPPLGSIVLDSDGIAWQSLFIDGDIKWVSIAYLIDLKKDNILPWGLLLYRKQYVTIIYTNIGDKND